MILSKCPICGGPVYRGNPCMNEGCPANQSSAPSPRSDVGENDLGGGWVPEHERMPLTMDDVLVFDGEFRGVAYCTGGHWVTDDLRIKTSNITHWKPMAEPPKPPHEFESPEPPSAERGTPAVPEEGCERCSELEEALEGFEKKLERNCSHIDAICSDSLSKVTPGNAVHLIAGAKAALSCTARNLRNAWRVARDVLNKEVK